MSWWSTACKFLLKSIPIKCLSSCLCPSNDNIRFESQSKCSQELCCPESWCMLLDSGHGWWRRLRMQNEEQSIITLSLRDGLLRLSPDKDLGIYFKCYQHIYMGIYFQAFLMLSIMWAVHPQNWQKFAWSKLVWEHSLSQWWVWESQHQSLWGYLNLSCFFFSFSSAVVWEGNFLRSTWSPECFLQLCAVFQAVPQRGVLSGWERRRSMGSFFLGL